MSQTNHYSLQKRLLLNTSIVLVFFIAAMSFILLNAYKSGIKQATYERLYAHFYSLLSVADQVSPGELFIPEEPLMDQRFNQFASGLSALVFDETESLIWQSLSVNYDPKSNKIELPISLAGEPTLSEIELKDEAFFRFHYIAEWESEEAEVSLYHFIILENKRPFNQVINAYRNKLWMWLSGLALSLILILFVVLRWTLAPIRQAAAELHNIEKGLIEQLSESYPVEIQTLTNNINRFIHNERHQSLRYKDTLANLAHSLKTPLAVMQTAIQNKESSEGIEKVCAEQLQRMNQIVAYQLHRATSGPQVMMRSLKLGPIIEKLVKGLSKVYQAKGISINSAIPKDLLLPLNEGDIYEVCGNLTDNACKWARKEVFIEAYQDTNNQVIIEISDDGPGIPEKVRDSVLTRGKRLDETVEGQGIGMSVVKEIVDAYKGAIEISRSQQNGTMIRLIFNV